MNRSPAFVCLLSMLLSVACGGGGDAIDGDAPVAWQMEMPEGVRVIEAEVVPRAERSEVLRPVLDLEVGGEGEGEPPFLSANDLAVAPDGRIYLLDAGAQQVRVFAPDGAPLPPIGAPGQGPGELTEAAAVLTVTDDRVVVADPITARFTLWDLDGELVGTLVPQNEHSIAGEAEELAGLTDGSLVVVRERAARAGERSLEFRRFGIDGQSLADYPLVPVEYTRALIGGRRGILPVVRGRGHMAVAPSGPLYLTPGNHYQVLALDLDGAPRWALQADWPREIFPEGEVERAFDAILGPMRAMGMEMEPDHDSVENLPEYLPALTSVKVDGRGNLWVFPYEHWTPGRPETLGTDRPVDVYSPHGERLFTGLIPAEFALPASAGSPWIVAAGEHVYGLEVDPASFEQRLVRYRLELPF